MENSSNMDVKKNCSVKTPHSENDSSDYLPKTPSNRSTTSEGFRTSERRRNKPEFSMPKRSDVWDNIEDVPTKGTSSLLRRRLVNDFVVNNYRYNYDANYTSGEESAFVESAEESDGITKAKMKQQKAIKKRIKNSSKRQQRGSDSSESFDSSEESVMKAKKLILKTMCKKVHMKNSTRKPLSESLESSDNSSNAVLKPTHRKQKVICSSESDSSESQKKILNAAKISLISKRKKALQALQSSSSSSHSDSEAIGVRRDKSTMDKDEKAKILSVMKTSIKHTHFKWESSEEEDKQKIVSITKKARNAGTISSEWSGSVSDVRVEDSSENSRSDRDFYLKELPTEITSTKTTDKNSDQQTLPKP